MPRVDLPHTNISRTGTADGTEVNGDATNFHSSANDGHMFIEVRNADAGGAHTVTVKLPGTVDGQAVASRTYSIPASSKRRIGPWPPAQYGSSLEVDVDSSQLKLVAYHLGT